MEPVQVADKHICGVCHEEFLTEQEYLAHTCAVTQTQPTDPEHLINSTTPDFAAVQQAALERGAADERAEAIQAAEISADQTQPVQPVQPEQPPVQQQPPTL